MKIKQPCDDAGKGVVERKIETQKQCGKDTKTDMQTDGQNRESIHMLQPPNF